MNILKTLLTLSILFGAASCKSLEEYKSDIEAAMKGTDLKNRSLIVKALKHPALFEKYGYDFEKMKDIPEKELKEDKPYKFYRMDAEIENMTAAIKSNQESDLGVDVKARLDVIANQKKRFLSSILDQVPVLNQARAGTDDADKAITSQVEKFIYDAVAYDGHHLSFANLHKAVDSLKGAFMIERKARDAATAAIDALDKAIADKKSTSPKLVLHEKSKTPEQMDSFHFSPKLSSKKEDKTKAKEPEVTNFLKIALKASDKSTSSATQLFYTLLVSTIIAISALIFKAFYKSEKDEQDFGEGEEL